MLKRPYLEALDLKDWDEWSDVERDEFTAYARELDRLLPCLLIRCEERGCGRYATRRHPPAETSLLQFSAHRTITNDGSRPQCITEFQFLPPDILYLS